MKWNAHWHVLPVLQVYWGQTKLTRCTVRKCGASPAEQLMLPDRRGAVQLSGPGTLDLQHCYVEVGSRRCWIHRVAFVSFGLAEIHRVALVCSAEVESCTFQGALYLAHRASKVTCYPTLNCILHGVSCPAPDGLLDTEPGPVLLSTCSENLSTTVSANHRMLACILCPPGALNCAAIGARHKGRLTRKDSLLVSWGRGTDQHILGCPVAVVADQGTQLNMAR
jgi:hypothetical protein